MMPHLSRYLLPTLLVLGVLLISCGCTGTGTDTGTGADNPETTVSQVSAGITPTATQSESAAGNVVLTVLSDPPFAAVLLDGEYLGVTTPASIEVPAGSHTIAVEATNGQISEKQISTGQDSVISFEIPRVSGAFGSPLTGSALSKTGWAVVKATDPYVYISVNNNRIVQDVVQTPYLVPALKEGQIDIKVEDITSSGSAFGFNEGGFPIISGIYSPVSFSGGTETLELYSIASTAYSGSAYSIGGGITAGRIPESREWQTGFQYISVKTDDGYISYPKTDSSSRTITIEPRDVTWYPVTVTSSPSGADILIDGIPTGRTTPWTIENVSDGSHTIMVSHPGYLPEEEEIYLTGDVAERLVAFPGLDPYTNGYLVVDSNEPGSYIMMYGKDTGDRTPTVYPAFPIGTAEVTVVNSAGESLTQSVTVIPDTVTTLYAEFT